MHILFDSHPKIKGSLNTMTSKERRGIDYAKWEINDTGYINSVEVLMPAYTFEDKLLWDDSGKDSDIATSGLLPLEVQEWFDENANGLWFYEVRMGINKQDAMFYRKMAFTFHFEKTVDAAMFKMRWI